MAHCDGSFMPRGSAGFVVYAGSRKIAARSEILEGLGVTASVCEYVALIRVLEYLIERGLTERAITIRADFKPMVDHLSGRAPVRSEHLVPLYLKAKELVGRFTNLVLEWTPRLLNNGADQVARRGLRD